MDSTPEKKPKRPRIGQPFHTPEEGNEVRPRFMRPENNEGTGEGDDNAYRQKRPYQPRPNNNYNRPYNNRPQYNNGGEGGDSQYQQRPYQPRQQRPYNNNGGGYNNGPRQQRPYNKQGGGYNTGPPKNSPPDHKRTDNEHHPHDRH